MVNMDQNNQIRNITIRFIPILKSFGLEKQNFNDYEYSLESPNLFVENQNHCNLPFTILYLIYNNSKFSFCLLQPCLV